MRLRSGFCVAVFLTAMAGGMTPASAEPKPWYWSWWPSHWQDQTFQPYLDDGKRSLPFQWEGQRWEPADWSAQYPGGAQEVIKGFYTAQILYAQDVKNGVPNLVIGPNFYHLSGYDKRRVVEMVDDYYQITTSNPNGMFTVTDWRTRKPIGLYTAQGLQLQ